MINLAANVLMVSIAPTPSGNAMTSSSPRSRAAALSRFRFFAGAVLGYLAVPILNAVSPLLALPSITASYGGPAWEAIAVGQSLGGTAGVIVELGWGLSGSQRVARMSGRSRARTFGISLLTKGIVGVPVIGLASVVAFVMAPEGYGLESATVAAAAGIAMFSAGWIFIGILKPRLFLFTEVLPRALLISGAAVAIHFGAALWAYSGALLLAAVGAPVAGAVVLGLRWCDLTALGPRRLLRVIGYQGAALSTNVFSSVYISLGTTVATLGSANATLLFASVDRLQRMLQQVLRSQNFVFKGWVGREVDPSVRIQRAVRATMVSTLIGVVSGILFAVCSPWAADVIFSGTVTVPPLAAAISGLSIAIICTTMSTGAVLLVALGRVGAVARSAATGAVIGLPGIFFGAMFLGGTGALAGQLLAEASVLVVQVVAVRRRLRENRESGRWQTSLVQGPPTVSSADRHPGGGSGTV